ncbi:3-phosphoshikimate 1-carboxyvinyltransferase [Ruminococcus champanellensis]|uniref:3-phosphoshikimate 1-carboxyvinyltransferase n=1 Tax=Ruminococcus champanellensis (strain DSM 18848 / JCM 17042 / KCTC 15320 / 18P13) TaxID=213810 RepID=D4LDE6_RUMC1|nr:3-phosphoshikimate 1-carboxyvinyltransferase [Ruminococcus champanellensis]CBL17641.1 3-phosphoshikimate 1-carboxyvinyltransferase [Ruminococcus champanellensis 18P13 = JCM 17042]
MNCVIEPGLLEGTVSIPASKSAAHRALICAALAKGTSRLTNLSDSEDIAATIGALQQMGAKITRTGSSVTVTGILEPPTQPITLDCGESGSTLRFLIPVAAALGLTCTIIGKGRLPYRPLDAYLRELPKKGISIQPERQDALLPLHMSGKLQSGVFQLEGDVSSQYLTGLLLALPLLEGDSRLELTSPLESAPYVDMTAALLRQAGVPTEKTPEGYRIPGGGVYHPLSLAIEGDYSQAAFFLTANALGSHVRVDGLGENSCQGDRKIVEILRELCYTKENTIASGLSVYAADIPDLVPVLTVLACLCGKPSRIYGAKRLRLKESDRLAAIAAALNAIGGQVSQTEDGLEIQPIAAFTGGTADSCGDHRIAMSLAVAATRSTAPVTILGAEAVRKSYPDFWSDYQKLGGTVHVISLE